MVHKTRLMTVMLALTALGIAGGCRTGDAVETEASQKRYTGGVYTAYNIWHENADGVSCVNYHRGAMIPAGTALQSAEVSRKNRIKFVTQDGREFTLRFRSGFHPGVSIHQYLERMVTERTFEELTANFTQEEIDAIQRGTIVIGMSKEAVIISRGYPPEHETPTTSSNVWKYWENRFKTKLVHFDANGRAIRGGGADDL